MRYLIERLERTITERAGQLRVQDVRVFEVTWDRTEDAWVADVNDEGIVDAERGPLTTWPVDPEAIYTALENENVAPAAIDKMLAGTRPIKLPGRQGLTVRVEYEKIKRGADPAYWRD